MSDVDGNAGFGLRCVVVTAVLAMAPTLAYAYIDPGNGAYMVQAMFALMGAAFFYLRHPIRTLKSAWNWTLERFRRPSQANKVDYSSTAALGGVNDSDAASASPDEGS